MATCVFKEPDLIERTVRDLLTEDVDRIVVDNQKADGDRMVEMISKYLEALRRVKIKFYSRRIRVRPVQYQQAVEQTFQRQVYLKGGGEIVIDETEALVAIDVNTGSPQGRATRKTPFSR